MESLLQQKPYENILNRLDKLTPETQPTWGKMDIAQMLAHCQGPLKVALGKMEIKKPNVLMIMVFKLFKKSLYSDKPWQKGLPTSAEFKVVDTKDFETEKKALLEWIAAFHAEKNKTDWPPHPFCGHFTPEQWGKMQYKHLDHHLTQFGV